MAYILVHGLGHKVTSWKETVSYMDGDGEIFCPDLTTILNGKDATYTNLYASFVEYCSSYNAQINLCGLSLGGILALNYALDYPEKVKTLVLIGAPHKIPKILFAIQNIVFRFMPKSLFEKTAFNKKDTSVFTNSIKNLDFCDRIHNIMCPTLIICGRKDSANLKSAHYFNESINNAKFVIMENTGHVVNEESPKELAMELNNFFRLHKATN